MDINVRILMLFSESKYGREANDRRLKLTFCFLHRLASNNIPKVANCLYLHKLSRLGSCVGIATGYGLDCRGIESR
jgi:hypothetical protein